MKITIHTFTGKTAFRVDAEMSSDDLARYARQSAEVHNAWVQFRQNNPQISVFIPSGSGPDSIGSHVFFSPTHSYRGHMDWREAEKAIKLDAEADALFVSEIKRVLGDFKFYVEEADGHSV
ncbi:hypothetical protein FO488_15885 [Geobacter sp. FeAm09]|uniref:hypothetical protein n=1 Tax=Geobacter sp. FeAm09 TaxID=2597769 RepID=UPI0011ECE094|nr:hypothetical protein [Geobacter sp. FeAm09]QEM69488.1 hypothetical protein FO488_15885 [Geobacter sp. FeAm09]